MTVLRSGDFARAGNKQVVDPGRQMSVCARIILEYAAAVEDTRLKDTSTPISVK